MENKLQKIFENLFVFAQARNKSIIRKSDGKARPKYRDSIFLISKVSPENSFGTKPVKSKYESKHNIAASISLKGETSKSKSPLHSR